MATRSTFLVCTRGTDKQGKFNGEPGPTTFLRVAQGKSLFSPVDKLSPERWLKAVVAASDGVEDEITGSTGEILFFVHGYNNTPEAVLWRTRKLQETLGAVGWRGQVIGFDWPSENSTLNYLEDRSDAAAVAMRLIEDVLRLLIDAQFPSSVDDVPCSMNVHMLGHSTGAYVIMEAFAAAAKRGEFYKKPWRIGQVAFIGGDVSSESLSADSSWATPMYDRILRLTNYSNGFDSVLAVSNAKRLGTAPRVGRVGFLHGSPRKAVNVDCSHFFKSKDPEHSEFQGTFNHSWHIGDLDFALDLALTLEGEMDRGVFPTRRLEDGRHLLIGGGRRPDFQNQWNRRA